MTVIRKTSPAKASAGRSIVRAPRKTVRATAVKVSTRAPAKAKAATAETAKTRSAAAARIATIAKTRKPIDVGVVVDASDEDGQRRAAQALARAEAAATKAATKKATTKKAPAKKAPAKKATTKKAPAKKATTKKTVDKTTTAKAASTKKLTTTSTTAATPPSRTRGPSGVRRTAVDRANDPPPETGLALIDRVRRSIEREITRIEVIVGGHHVDTEQRTEAERRARTLASLTKTLAELRRLRADEELQRPLDDDAIPRDLDELRRALSRRLEQLVGDAAQPAAAGDE
uniref:Uncharacterized protein n=1 Tax=Rhodopseudomonas palustris (strain BisA53) TaxID=316055 RepID=Q07QE4_RHOP5